MSHAPLRSLLRMAAVAALAILPLALVLVSCTGERDGDRRYPGAPVVLISIDTLRSDRLPIYGYAGGSTPAIDALRRDGILAARAYTHTPLTLPAHVSILSGLLPPDHGVRDNLGYSVAATTTLLSTLLRDAGYATAGSVSAAILRRSSGIAAGFDQWDEPGPGEGLAAVEAERPGTATLAAIRPWLRRVASGPFFLFFHLYEPHAPHRPPPSFAARLASAYDGEIAASDSVVGELVAELRSLEVYDRAIVVLLSDHGEGLGDHGEREHGVFLYREALQVPLVIKLPGSRLAGATIESPAQLVDVVPTVLALVGVPAPPSALPGRSLLELDQEDAARPAGDAKSEPGRRIYAETYYPRLHFGWSELRSMIAGNLHFIDGPDPELYDLAADPAEREPVLERESATARALRAALAEIPSAIEEPAAESPETRSRLAALGYLDGGSAAARSAGGAGGSSALPDPKTKLAVLESLEASIDAEARGDLDASVAALRDLVAAEPESASAWSRLAAALERRKSFDDALAARRRAFEVSRGGSPEALDLARLLATLGRADEAREVARAAAAELPERAAALDDQLALAEGRAAASRGDGARAVEVLAPLAERGNGTAMVLLATALSDGGRQREARAWVERALDADQGNAVAHETLGLVLLRDGSAAAAIDPLRRATSLDSSRANAWNLLGAALERGTGDHVAAIEAWQRALALAPDRFDVLFNLATVAADSGSSELARESFARFVAEAPPSRWAAELPRARERLRALGGVP